MAAKHNGQVSANTELPLLAMLTRDNADVRRGLGCVSVPVSSRPRTGGSYSFHAFTLDPVTGRLYGDRGEINLRPKSFQVLQYLVKNHGRLITRAELLEVVWGDVSVTDESVTKCIADIRKALDDDAHSIIRTVTRRGFRFQADVILTPAPPDSQSPAILQSVVPGEAARPELGIPGDAVRDSAGAPAPRSSLRRLAWMGALAVFTLASGITWFAWTRRPYDRPPAFDAIAVLPFESLSSDADQKYLADGMTEALITNLGQAGTLRVIARTSVGQYEGTKKPVREIARELNVDVLVEGTVTTSGERIRVTANLIQVSPEKHIWARAYERNMRDALALQNEIAGAIATEIQGKLTPQQESRLQSSRPVDPDAQLAYWTARYLLSSRKDPEGIRTSIAFAEQAVRLDPGYAHAYATLARSLAMLSGGETIPPDAAVRAKAAAKRAIELDEELASAHAALGLILIAYDWNWTEAEREMRRAISLNPSDADAHEGLANYLAAVGRTDEAVLEIKQARALDPYSFRINWNVGRMLCLARRYGEALAELTQTAQLQREISPVDIWMFRSYWMKGLVNEAIATDLRIRQYRDGLSQESLDALRAAFSAKGPRGYWTALRETLLPQFSSTANGVFRLAEINVHLGDKEEAFRWLEKAYESRTAWMPWIKVDPVLDPLRSDPRFDGLLRRMDLIP